MTQPAKLQFTIYQGATFSQRWERLLCDYAVAERNGQLVNAATGKPVPAADLTSEDYTGCTARMQVRSDIHSPRVLFEMSTADSSITLGVGWGQIDLSEAQTSALQYGSDPARGKWRTAVGQMEITRPDGVTVERHYEIAFNLDPGGTR